MTHTTVMAVIKANGYGHGVLAVAQALTAAGAEWLGVARIEEALNLRREGITSEIMVLGYTAPVKIPDAIEQNIHVAIYDVGMAKAYAAFADKMAKRLKAHLKVETGMGRLGMPHDQSFAFLQEFHQHPQIEIDGIFTHFARADEPNAPKTMDQLAVFNHLLYRLIEEGIKPPVVHAANSAAVINFPEAYFDLVRPGITLFGLSPSPDMSLPKSFRRALTWKARLTSVREFPAGHGISYGSVYVTTRKEWIGVIPVGYGDGFRRVKDQQVLVHGKRVNVVGRICMDQCMLQLDDVPDAVAGDEVVLLGEQGEQEITAEELARKWGTINYEVLCGLADRLPRLYKE
jgi:alanine racemase